MLELQLGDGVSDGVSDAVTFHGVTDGDGESDGVHDAPHGDVELGSTSTRDAYTSAMSMGRKSVPKNPRYQHAKTHASAYVGDDLAA